MAALVPTCMFVVGRGLWSLCAAALLEEEGGSFDHEEAFAEAGGRKKQRKQTEVLTRAKSDNFPTGYVQIELTGKQGRHHSGDQ